MSRDLSAPTPHVESNSLRRGDHARKPTGRLNRLLELVEQGLMDISDPALKERLETAKHDRAVAVERARLLEAASAAHPSSITPESITRLAASLRQALGVTIRGSERLMCASSWGK